MQSFRAMLIVEDEPELGAALLEETRAFCSRVHWAKSLAEAHAATPKDFDVALIDMALPDGKGHTLVAELLALRPMPLVVAMTGVANSTEAFEVAISGVHALVTKPLQVSDLHRMLLALRSTKRPMESAVALRAGDGFLHDTEREVRRAMLIQTLSRCGGNRSAAAKLLGVSRQAVQHMIRDFMANEGLPPEVLTEKSEDR
jgi:two-component system, response regulator RegA